MLPEKTLAGTRYQVLQEASDIQQVCRKHVCVSLFVVEASGASRAPALFSLAQCVCQPSGDGAHFPDPSGEH
ncbi:hypothetical protein EMIT0P74_60156 [Pseudomonas sp. IT-P74]